MDTKQRTIIKYKHDIENQKYEQHGQLRENRGWTEVLEKGTQQYWHCL